MFTKVFVILAASSAALATVFVTAPVASTIYTGGQPAVVKWQDDGNTPTLQSFGPSKVSIYAGNAQQQTLLQSLNSSIDVSLFSEVDFTVDPTIGPNSSQYFIRFESLSLKDATQPQFPALAFSAKFTLNNMTGAFTADVLSEIAGQSTAPLATQSAVSITTTTGAATTTTQASSATSKAASSTVHTSATASASSGALTTRVGWAGVALGALVGITMF